MSSDELKNGFGGKWKVYKSEKFEDFLKEMGVNLVMRKAAANMSPTNTISIDGNSITINIEAGPKKMEEKYTLNEEVDRKTDSGEIVKSKATFVDGKLTIVNTPTDATKKVVTIVREIQGDDLVMTMTRGEVSAKRYFKKA
ncbi:fatty acid-binding protein homolog 6-like [Mytilus californianus]|uniref:fatty acid-binding protein homolog 6-like n=1 Tax=Mytilus californianus TaxID=6549 RepID=UPI0022481588|nr:fatty acid-binding protein homolog 6-like [Mytilus californianus]